MRGAAAFERVYPSSAVLRCDLSFLSGSIPRFCIALLPPRLCIKRRGEVIKCALGEVINVPPDLCSF